MGSHMISDHEKFCELETLNMTEAGRFANAENILGTNSMFSDCVTLDFYPRFKIHHIPIMVC